MNRWVWVAGAAAVLALSAWVAASRPDAVRGVLAQSRAQAAAFATTASAVPDSAAARARSASMAMQAAYAPRADRPIFVLNSLDADVSVIDPVSRTQVRRVPTGKEPHHLYLSPDEKSLLVANAAGNSITLLDPHTGAVQRTLDDIVDPYQLQFSPDMKWFVTASNRLDHVDIYRVIREPGGNWGLELARRIGAAKTPSHIMIDSKSTVAYVSLQDSDQLIAIDLATQTPRWTIQVGKMPADVFLTSDDATLLVGLTGDSVVEAWNVAAPVPELVKRIPTGDGAHAFRSMGDQRHVLVSNRVANTVSRIDMSTLSVVDQYPAPGGPDCMDLLADGRTIVLTSRWARKLSFVDMSTRQVVHQVDVGRSPHGVWTLDHAPRR